MQYRFAVTFGTLSKYQGADLKFKVDGRVVIPDIGHILNAFNSLRDNVGVLHAN